MPWSEIADSPAVIGLGTGWVAFFAVVFMVLRSVSKGDAWVPGIVHQRVVDAFDKSTAANAKLTEANATLTTALASEVEAHRETQRQLGDEIKPTGEIVRKFFTDLSSVMPE